MILSSSMTDGGEINVTDIGKVGNYCFMKLRTYFLKAINMKQHNIHFETRPSSLNNFTLVHALLY